MSFTSIKSSHSQTASKYAGNGSSHAGDSDFSAFSLRDTLGSIVVREANFSEFLSALKQSGLHTTRR
jgi:hypothetical protein